MGRQETAVIVLDAHTLRKLEFKSIVTKVKNFTATGLGRKLVEAMAPITNVSQLEEAHSEVEEATRIIEYAGPLPLGGIRDIESQLNRVQKGFMLTAEEFLDISTTLYGARQVRVFVDKLKKEERISFPAVDAYAAVIGDFTSLERAINNVLDENGDIRDSASDRLGRIRREQKLISRRIKEKLETIITNPRLDKIIQEPVITIRGDRYVIPVKAEYRGSFPGILHDRSSSRQTLFIEPQAVVEMNNRLRSLEKDEEEEVQRLLQELTGRVSERCGELEVTLSALAQLDFIMTKARFGVAYKCCRPVLNAGGPVRLYKARHPLIKEEEVVPIDIFLGTSFSTLVITGPNTGGKTVTLKTLGLLCLMAQAGLPIPADEKSEIGVFSGIYADIGDEQSIEQSLSTFSSHMNQIVRILNRVQPRELVLLDEVGAGTDPEEGAALAMAILQTLHRMGTMTVATTHYTELKGFAYIQEGMENAAVEFDAETLAPTYRLLIGVPGRSNAFAIARRLGLADDIINKARDLVQKERSDIDTMINQIEKEEYALLQEKDDMRRARLSFSQQEAELKKAKEETYREMERTIADLYNKADRLITGIKEEGEKLLREIRAYGGPDADRLANRFNQAIKEKEKALWAFRKQHATVVEREKAPAEVNPGDAVKVLSLDQEGSVIAVEGEQAQVQVGIMKIWVSRRDLIPVEVEEIKTRSRLLRLQGDKARDVSSRLSIRGMRWEEARDKTDKYLDDAYLAGLKQITIVHGKGTGALREAVHELLWNHPHIKEYRLGGPGEGGDGVTIVSLRE